MDENINDIELQWDEMISRYLRGQMNEQEERSFVETLSKNPELKEKAVSIACMAKGINQIGVHRDEEIKDAFVSADVSSVESIALKACNKRNVKMTPVRAMVRWTSVAAASVILFYVGFQTSEFVRDESHYDELQYNRGVVSEDFIGYEIDALTDRIEKGENLEITIEHLAFLWSVSMRDTYNEYTDYRNEIGLALVDGYLKNNDREAAMEVLETLLAIVEEGSAQYDAIKERINKLNNQVNGNYLQ